MYGNSSDLGMEPYLPRVAPDLRTLGWEIPAVLGDIDQGVTVFVVVFLDLSMYRRIPDPRIMRYPPRVALAPPMPRWSLHTVRRSIDLGEHRFRREFARDVYVWTYL